MVNLDLKWLIDTDPDIADPLLCGHKVTRQVELSTAGFTVPPLVCIPAPVFDLATGHHVATVEDDVVTPAEQAVELRERIRAAGIPSELREELHDRFDAIAGPDGLVAVRACVVPQPGREDTGEDSAADPFAGLSDSFLYVRKHDIADRVAECWASAFTPESVLYRMHRGLDPFAARVAVAVQRMVLGARSFVAFSRNPLDQSRTCVIAAAHGIGEGVVQERADVDHFYFDQDSATVDAHVVEKSRALGWEPTHDASGPSPIQIPEALANQPVLTDAEVRQISEIALRAEQHFGAPQDLEGTIPADGEIHLVQTRPIAFGPPAGETVPAVPPRAEDDGQRPESNLKLSPAPTRLWDNNNITESFPGISCALTYTVGRDLFEVGFTDLYRRMGVPSRVLRRNQPRLRRMIGYLDGHIYYAIDNWYHLHGLMRCFRPLWSTWEKALGLAGRDAQRVPPGRVATAMHFAEIAARFLKHPRRITEFLQWWDDYHARLDVTALSPSEVETRYRALWGEVSQRWGLTLVNGVFLFTATWATNRLLQRWAPQADRSVLNGMLSGGKPNRSAEAVHSAIALAGIVAQSPTLKDAFLTHDDAPLWNALMHGTYGPEISDALAEHVRRYGDRGLQDLKLEAITPREEPWTVLPAIRAYLRQGRSVRESLNTAERVRRDATRELRRHVRHPARRTVLRSLFNAMRLLLRYREDTRFCRSQLFGDLRALLLRQGEHLTTAGRLDDPRDVLDLTVEEVLGAFDGSAATADVRSLAASRKAERLRWIQEACTYPPRLALDPDQPLTTALESFREQHTDATLDQDNISGLPSSGGIVQGRAMVVLEPTVTADTTRDRILVARETDPGWLFLMMSAKALVVERGTLLSHTAITGRLLGIPTVVAVPGATSRIPDNAMIEVDGSAGTIRILEATP